MEKQRIERSDASCVNSQKRIDYPVMLTSAENMGQSKDQMQGSIARRENYLENVLKWPVRKRKIPQIQNKIKPPLEKVMKF